MMLRVSATLFVLCVFSSGTLAAPKYRSGVKACYGEQCPENTFACEKLSGVSRDRKNINEEIHCLDLRDKVLKNVTRSHTNYFGDSVIFQGYSYSGVYEIYDSGEVTTGVYNVPKNPESAKKDSDEISNEVEKINVYSPKPKYSELDDLNKVHSY